MSDPCSEMLRVSPDRAGGILLQSGICVDTTLGAAACTRAGELSVTGLSKRVLRRRPCALPLSSLVCLSSLVMVFMKHIAWSCMNAAGYVWQFRHGQVLVGHLPHMGKLAAAMVKSPAAAGRLGGLFHPAPWLGLCRVIVVPVGSSSKTCKA